MRDDYSDSQILLKRYLENTFSNETTINKRLYGYILMYALNEKKTMLKVRQCCKYITDYETDNNQAPTQKIIIGNK